MKRFSRFLTVLLLVFSCLSMLLPQTYAATDFSDPALTDIVIIPDEPAPEAEVDFIVAYANHGSLASQPLTLLVDFDENIFKRIVVGDPKQCVNTGITVTCNLSPLNSGESGSIGFTGFVADNARLGDKVITYASIKEPGNADDKTTNNLKELTIRIGKKTKQTIAAASGTTTAELLKTKQPLEAPSDNQDVSLFNVENDPNWRVSGLYTAGLKFIIRGKEALAWSLGIDQSGFHNPAIRQNYVRVLTVVNSFFIIGLLAIAAMWIFSLLIPRNTLKKVILVYALAVVFVNFALPINQLFIDGTGLLQKTFISDVDITKIARTPNYNDRSAVGYENQANFLKTTDQKNLSLTVSNEESDSTVSTPVGRIGQGLSSLKEPNYIGTIMIPIADDKGNVVKVEEQTVQLRSTADQVLSLDAGQKIALSDETGFDPNKEHSVFAFLMFLFTGLAYFGMALLFIIRIVILWALMIVSPILFLLAVFRATRGYFVSWLGIYARWLFIGPLLALGISIVVNIWEAVGLPIRSTYVSTGQFGLLSNIGFYLPGTDTVNTLSTTPQMMEYFLFLIMLYLPLFFAFMLTRQKFWAAAASTVVEKVQSARRESASAALGTESAKTEKTVLSEAKSLAGGVKGFLGSKLTQLTSAAALPKSLQDEQPASASRQVETASSFLPQQLALAPMKELLDLTAGDSKNSRNAHEKSIEILANPGSVSGPGTLKQVMAVRQEIEERAEKGDGEALHVMSEIHEHETSVTPPSSFQVKPDGKPIKVDVSLKEKANTPPPPADLKTKKEIDDTKNPGKDKQSRKTQKPKKQK